MSSKDDRCVHTEHCCKIHGCKYGNDNCPVMTEQKDQSFLCETCYWYIEEYERFKHGYADIRELKEELELDE